MVEKRYRIKIVTNSGLIDIITCTNVTLQQAIKRAKEIWNEQVFVDKVMLFDMQNTLRYKVEL